MKMKSFKLHRYFGILLIFILCATSGNAQKTERTIEKTFPINPDGKLTLDNSYGNLTLNQWDKNEVHIRVNISVEGSDRDRQEDVLENISINFNHSPESVSAQTNLKTESAWWQKWNLFKRNNLNYSIDYYVQLPKTIAVDLNNDYGRIFLDELEGAATIRCDYGSIDIGRLEHSDNRINLQYAPNSTIDYINAGSIEADYSGLIVEAAQNIDLNTDYSKNTFKSIHTLNFNADYGSLTLGEVHQIIGNGDYVSIKIETLSKKADLTVDYGGLKISNIQPSTEHIRIDSDYAGIKLTADDNWSFQFSIATQYSGFKTDFHLEYRKKIIESNNRFYQGQHREGLHQLDISSEYGAVKLYQN